ncbi:hypothetical protein P691DRAFT_774035 [Macrolepiota fuliginosa MF-IS2]|uniref:Uncharacterized protein n=1 Tax=Macrolepiota fuliginosa MF-IS2 TaxID=1400762 RepID=A0A9P5XH78_9AGAR|nr:hypothetical protein P691DRAFT_774035 [Macrolepiota fuliginosa MF-IS2]
MLRATFVTILAAIIVSATPVAQSTSGPGTPCGFIATAPPCLPPFKCCYTRPDVGFCLKVKVCPGIQAPSLNPS